MTEPTPDPVLAEPEGQAERIELQRRTPLARARYLEEERARLTQAGASTEVLDLAEQAMQGDDRERVDGLLEWTTRVVGGWCRDHHNALFELPFAVSQRLIAQVTVAYLYGQGLLSPSSGDAEARSLEWREVVPTHLLPDVAGELARHKTLRAALLERRPAREWPSLNSPRQPEPADREEEVADGGED